MDKISYLPCHLQQITNLTKEINQWDTICLIDIPTISELSQQLLKHRNYDAAFDKEVSCFMNEELNCRVVYSPIGEIGDYDDARKFGEAAGNALSRAVKAGSKKPMIILPESTHFENVEMITLLGALKELYVPIQLREDCKDKQLVIQNLGVFMENSQKLKTILDWTRIYESGIFIARDIGIGDPERMAPPRAVEYLRNLFDNNGPIKINIVSDPNIFKKEYPLYEAVNRAANAVPRHRGSIVFLEYKPPNPAKKTLMLVGKGVTYDTGGADVKSGGVMAGMSRDKCGAAAVAGFMKVVSEIKPLDIHVFGALCLVRNSIGEECYVADEVITSRSGQRVCVGNTDAEGRMCMADTLAQFKEMAVEQNLPNPHLFTIATLTGHACLAVGEGYSICVDNKVASNEQHSYKLKQESEKIGDPFEISTLRKEDFTFHTGRVIGEDILQCNNLPSSQTARGHITPAAFIMMASGLDKHGLNSSKPLKYSHLDIAASAGEFPKIPTGSPILALAKTHLF